LKIAYSVASDVSSLSQLLSLYYAKKSRPVAECS